MSIEINWEALTGSPAGDALAESIRAFIHERFQQVELPKLIRSVKVHAFDFGNVPPELVLKDVCDPLPDFYGEDDDDDEDEDDLPNGSSIPNEYNANQQEQRRRNEMEAHDARMRSHSSATTAASESRGRPFSRPTLNTSFTGAPSMRSTLASPTGLLTRAQTPGIPGGTANMSYFHLPLSSTRSGAITPLAAVAGGHYGGWPEMHQSYNHYTPSNDLDQLSPELHRASTSHHNHTHNNHNLHHSTSHSPGSPPTPSSSPPTSPNHKDNHVNDDRSPDDVQIVAHLRYSGNIKLSLTAEILLDYPMPSFVGIPVQLNVTGLTFDGVAVIAYMKKKAHFCFLAPEDAEVVVVGDSVDGSAAGGNGDRAGGGGGSGVRVGGLFEEIKVESEIGLKVQGKQVLKNVGRVEKFVLEQVRRIFESEFVYPSFWTFLV